MPVTPRERVLTSIAHKEPDEVPFDYWAVPEVTASLQEKLKVSNREELLYL